MAGSRQSDAPSLVRMINRHLTVQLVTTAVRFIAHAGTFIATAFHLGQLRHFTISAADRGA